MAEASTGREPSDVAADTRPMAGFSTESSGRGRDFFRTVARLGSQIADALEYAHSLGVVHRDIKPANLLLDAQGTVWVADFGLAQIESDAALTMTGDLLGTARYMSPEQALGRPGGVDHRTDIYSLGITLYELLTLQLAFAAQQRHKVIRQVIEQEPKPPRNLDWHIPRDLETIVLKAIAKEPQSRYATAQELADDLVCFLNDRPIRAKRPGWLDRSAKWLLRNRVVAIATAALFAVLIMAASVSLRQARRASLAEQVAVVARGQVERHAGQMQHLLVSSLTEKGSDRYNQGHVDGLLTLLAARQVAEGDERLSASSAEFLTVAHHLLAGGVTAIYDDPMGSAISEQGDKFAWCSQEKLFLGDPRTGDCKPLQIDPKYLQVTKDEGGNYHDILGLKFSPDGEKLALNNPDQGVTLIWDLAAGSTWEPLRHERGMIPKNNHLMIGERTLDFCGSSRILATVSLEGVLTVWSLDESDVLFSHRFDNHITSVSISDDASRVAVGHSNNARSIDDRTTRLFVYSVDDPANEPIVYKLDEGNGRVICTMFSDAGRRVIGLGFGACAAWELDGDAEEVMRFIERDTERDFLGHLEDLAIDPIHSRLACGLRDGTALLVKLDTAEPIGQPLDHGGGGVRRARFGRDGKLLVTGGLDGNVQFWAGAGEPKHLSTWPQFGTIDQAFANVASEYSLSQSRIRHASQTTQLVLRQLPQAPFASIGKVPEGRIDFVPNANFTKFLVMDEPRKQVEIYTSSGKLESKGPQVMDQAHDFTSAIFHPDGKHLIVCEMIRHSRNRHQVIRSWHIKRQKYLVAEYSEQSSDFSHVRGFINEREAVASSASWDCDIIDPLLGERRQRLRVSGRPQGFARSDARQEFCIGATSGMVHFYDLETLDPIGPPMQVGDEVSSVAYTRDGKWLATVSRTKDRWNLRFWHLDGEAPFDSVVMRLPFSGSAIYPYGERGIIHAQGGQIMVLELPKAFIDLRTAELETWADVGLWQSVAGQVELIGGNELREVRAQRDALDRHLSP